ncbi:MAG: hypothetical protein IBX55_21155, partial [Methyloprofundus sp.]|nr:hypothetical protein [Methyloprofundus sp.]
MRAFLSGRWLISGLCAICVLAALAFPVSSIALAQDDEGLVIASWNIQRLGHGQNKDYSALASAHPETRIFIEFSSSL